MDAETFNEELLIALGGNLVDVELTEKDFEYAFNRAKRTFQQKGNNNLDKGFVLLSVTKDTRKYDIPESVDTVIRIIRPGYGGLFPENPWHYAIIQDIYNGLRAGGSSLVTYELSYQLIENIQKYMAHDVDFIFNKRRHTIEFLNTPKANEAWFLECYHDLPDEEYRALPWIQEWALTELKIILGRAYSKFGTLPGPSGEISMDGQSLIQEARDDQQRLIEEIGFYVDGDPTGGVILIG